MMESLGKATEIVDKAKDFNKGFNPDERIYKDALPAGGQKEEFDPDKRVEKSEAAAGKQNEGFDPDKRVEKTALSAEGQKEVFDPDKRVEKADGNDGKQNDLSEQKELTQEQKDEIKKETGWSDEIIDAIGSMEEYKIYKDAGLVEAEVNGKKCLINPNVDMEQKDSFGRTNKERMEQGLAPLDKDGKPIELHHIGQRPDSPLAELTQEQHRGKDNYSVLHDTKKESEIDRGAFAEERSDHWKARTEGENK